jgi:NAD(P)-dependent dehydrogenase (short-subunit alcohol dehydrogenase family)
MNGAVTSHVTSHKTIVITGASDGIGAAAARALAADGHEVVVVGRDPAKTAAMADELGVERHVADYARLDDVRALAAALAAAHPRIDVLANNAGGIRGARQLTADGHEMAFQVNHLAPFLLTNLLMDTLLASSAAVITTSSMASRNARLDLDDLDMAAGYAPFRAYGASKLANILFTRELHRRFHGRGLSSAAFHPGVVATSFGVTDGPAVTRFYGSWLARAVFASPAQGGSRLVRLAEGTPGVDWASGRYWVRGRIGRTSPQADDADAAHRLWEASAAMVGLA